MNQENAKKIIKEFFSLIGAPIDDLTYVFDEKRGHIFSIKSSEFEKKYAENESFVQNLIYLLKRIFNKDSLPGQDAFKCTLDINDMQSKADNKTKMKALNAAEEARNLKTDILMEPMTSYERMIVHSTLAGLPDISTESDGIGRARRVKVKYLAI